MDVPRDFAFTGAKSYAKTVFELSDNVEECNHILANFVEECFIIRISFDGELETTRCDVLACFVAF